MNGAKSDLMSERELDVSMAMSKTVCPRAMGEARPSSAPSRTFKMQSQYVQKLETVPPHPRCLQLETAHLRMPP